MAEEAKQPTFQPPEDLVVKPPPIEPVQPIKPVRHIEPEPQVKKITVKKEYKCKLVSESFGEGKEFETGEVFAKSWKFLNDGEFPWPADTRLMLVDGPNFGDKEKSIGHAVQIGETVEITINFIAP